MSLATRATRVPGPRLRAGLVLGLCCALVSACASQPTLPEAAQAWRGGRRLAALAAARHEVERFREGNGLSAAEVDAAHEAIALWLDETPIVLAEEPPLAPPGHADARPEPTRTSLDAGLRQDLAAAGATRSLRAIRAVMRLSLDRFAIDLLALAWRREPWTADTARLGEPSTALRSLVVKTAALAALDALARGTAPTAPATPPTSPR